MTSEVTSPEVLKIAGRGLKDPQTLSHDEIKAVCASCLTQAPDKPEEIPDAPPIREA